VIFSSAEQARRGRSTNRSLKDIHSIRNYLPPQQCVPDRIILKFKMPVSDFEMADLIDKYLSQKIGDGRSCWPSVRRMLNGSCAIKLPEDCSVEQMVEVLEQNPYVEYAEPDHIGYIIASHSTKRIPNPPGKHGKLKPIKGAQGEDLFMGVESTHRAGGTMRPPEAQKKENMQHKDVHGKKNLALPARKAGLKTVNKDSGIQPHHETDDNLRGIQSSDNERIIRPKTKIYTYRDSEGKLVITNYYFSKSNTDKK
jgi:hypothetical protein